MQTATRDIWFRVAVIPTPLILFLTGDRHRKTEVIVAHAIPSATKRYRKGKSGKHAFITTWDWRATSKPRKIHPMVFNWPVDGKFVLPALNQKVGKAYLLAGWNDHR